MSKNPKKATQGQFEDLDDLLQSSGEEDQDTPEQKRIKELEAQLKARDEADKEREEKQAQVPADEDDGEVIFDTPPEDSDDLIVMHVLKDGFMAAGVTWYRGQEIRVKPGSQQYEETKDRSGKSWLDLRSDPGAQYAKYGDQYFAEGPWPGRKWGDVTGITDEDERAAIIKAAKAEERRAGALPRLVSPEQANR